MPPYLGDGRRGKYTATLSWGGRRGKYTATLSWGGRRGKYTASFLKMPDSGKCFFYQSP